MNCIPVSILVTADKIIIAFGMSTRFHQILSILTMSSKEKNTSFASLAAVSVRLYFLVLRPQTSEPGALTGGKCQLSVDQLDIYKLL